MGHQVEYVIDSSPALAREWLSSLDGWWAAPESPDEMPWGELAWGGQALHADLGPAACWVRVPRIKYSWPIGGHAPSVDWVARFEGNTRSFTYLPTKWSSFTPTDTPSEPRGGSRILMNTSSRMDS